VAGFYPQLHQQAPPPYESSQLQHTHAPQPQFAGQSGTPFPMPSGVVDAEAPRLHSEEAPHTGGAAECAPPVMPFDFFGLKVLLGKPPTKVEGTDLYAFILTHQLLFLAPVVFAFYSQHLNRGPISHWYYHQYFSLDETDIGLLVGLAIGSLVLLVLCCWSFFKRMSVLAPLRFPHSKAGYQLTTHVIQLILLSSFLYFLPWFDVLHSEIVWNSYEHQEDYLDILVPIGFVALWVLPFVLFTRCLGLYAVSGEHATVLAMAWGTVYCDTMRCVAVPFLYVLAVSSSYATIWVFYLAMAFALLVVLIRLVQSLFSKPAVSRGHRPSATSAEQSYV